MIFKLRQRLQVTNFTKGNRLPNIRSRKFIVNYLRNFRLDSALNNVRACLGIVHWLTASDFKNRAPSSYRAQCFITGRSRGTTHRFGVARTKIKSLATTAFLLGAKKGSW